MTDTAKQVRVAFFRTRDGAEPVREWLRSMPKEDRQQIGVDLKTVEYGWPIGMPTCRALGEGLWEVRTKQRRTPPAHLRSARDRKRQWEGTSRDK